MRRDTRIKTLLVMAMLLIGMTAMVAQAVPLVTLDIQASGGVWEVYATVSGDIAVSGDNYGLAFFELDVVGSGGLVVDTSVNESPAGGIRDMGFTVFHDYGFSILRGDGTAGLGIAAAQPVIYEGGNDSFLDDLVIQGVGQSAGSYLAPSGWYYDPPPAASWAYPVLLASGTYHGLFGTLTALQGEASWGVLEGSSPWVGPVNVAETGVDSDFFFVPAPGDFNEDAVLDALDIDLLRADIAVPSGDPKFDVDGSTVVDIADLTYWLETLKSTKAGDIDLNLQVDGIDLTILGVNWQQSPRTWAQGNLNIDNVVDGIDLTILGVNWQWGVPEPPLEPVSAPEPATICLLAVGLAAVISKRKLSV